MSAERPFSHPYSRRVPEVVFDIVGYSSEEQAVLAQLKRYQPDQLPPLNKVFGEKFSLISFREKDFTVPDRYASLVNPNLVFIAEKLPEFDEPPARFPDWSKPAPQHLRPPRWIVDKGALIGKGGFGEVYEAWDTQRKEKVAIKITYADKGPIKHEAAATANAYHHNVVTIIDHVEAIEFNGQPASMLVMEHLGKKDGLWLHDIVTNHDLPNGREKRITTDLDFVIEIIYQLGKVLTDLANRHQSQLDLTLRNVFIKKTGELVLTDFNISAESNWRQSNPFVQSFTRLRQINSPIDTTTGLNPANTAITQGTPGYMSPETYLDRPNPEDISALQYDSVYCMAIVVFELLTGQKLFNPGTIPTGENPLLPYMMLTFNPLTPAKKDLLAAVEEKLGLYTGVLERVFSVALAHKPEDRFQTPQEFAGILANELDQSQYLPTLCNLHQATTE
jgi:serine/threonine protein kinase